MGLLCQYWLTTCPSFPVSHSRVIVTNTLLPMHCHGRPSELSANIFFVSCQFQPIIFNINNINNIKTAVNGNSGNSNDHICSRQFGRSSTSRALSAEPKSPAVPALAPRNTAVKTLFLFLEFGGTGEIKKIK